jgi:adenosylcobinamide-GDP ribazoletransferase
MTRTGLPGTPVADGSRLGQAVAGTVRPPVLAGWALVLAVAIAAGAGDPAHAGAVLGAAVAGLAAAELVLLRARNRLGGVSGDVMGAMGEGSTTVVLLVAAALLAPGG